MSNSSCVTWLITLCHMTDSAVSHIAHTCALLQCVAVCCSVLQCVAVCCSVLQCVAVCCSVLQCVAAWRHVTHLIAHTSSVRQTSRTSSWHPTYPSMWYDVLLCVTWPTPLCDTPYHTAIHCNTLPHTAPDCTTMQRTATHCNTLQRTATHYNALQHSHMQSTSLI